MNHPDNSSLTSHSDEVIETPSYDDINTPVVVMVGVISAVLTLLSMMFFQGLYYHWQERLSVRPVVQMSEEDLAPSQLKMLNEGPVSIQEAMKTVAAQFGKK